MNFNTFRPVAHVIRAQAAIILVVLVSGCAFFEVSNKPKPTELQAVNGFVSAKQAWVARIGPVTFALDVANVGGTLYVGSSDGAVAAIDSRTGADVWRTNVGSNLSAGVGSDGKVAAVVTTGNEVVALSSGREIWRQKLSAGVYTAPLVAGGRVFVLAADRSSHAFDGQTGRKL